MTAQQPIISGFDRDSTAEDVLANLDLSEQTASSPQLEGMGSVFREDCNIAMAVEPGTDTLHGVERDATDPDSARRVRTVSAEPTGVNAFAQV